MVRKVGKPATGELDVVSRKQAGQPTFVSFTLKAD